MRKVKPGKKKEIRKVALFNRDEWERAKKVIDDHPDFNDFSAITRSLYRQAYYAIMEKKEND